MSVHVSSPSPSCAGEVGVAGEYDPGSHLLSQTPGPTLVSLGLSIPSPE